MVAAAERAPAHLEVGVAAFGPAFGLHARCRVGLIEKEVDERHLEHVGQCCRLLRQRREVPTGRKLALQFVRILGRQRPRRRRSVLAKDRHEVQLVLGDALLKPGQQAIVYPHLTA